ncbi:MAG: hypothetical protein AB8B53_11410 [Flavobacteriales bacterium]
MRTEKLIWLLLILIGGLGSCNPNEEMEELEEQIEQEQEEEPLIIEVPCNVGSNTVMYSNFTYDLQGLAGGQDDVWGDWNAVGSGSSVSTRMVFHSEPTSGYYITQGQETVSFGNVLLTGNFGGYCVALSGDTVYVEVENNTFSATFCNVTFEHVSNNWLDDFQTSGNITDDF